MNISIKSVVLGLTVVFAASTALGQGEATLKVNIAGGEGVSWTGTAASSPVDSERATYAALAKAGTFDLRVDTPTDILLIDFKLDLRKGTLWNDDIAVNPYGAKLGKDLASPPTAALGNWPGLAADTWLTTPGDATAAADDTPFMGAAQATHFDTTGDGAQQGFQFANITLIPDAAGDYEATLSGSIQVSGTPVIKQPFSFTLSNVVPEPTAMSLLSMALLGCVSIVRRKRRS